MKPWGSDHGLQKSRKPNGKSPDKFRQRKPCETHKWSGRGKEQLPITHPDQQINTMFVCRGGLNQETIKWNWIERKGDYPTSMRFLDGNKFSASAVCIWDKWQASVMRALVRSNHIIKTSECFRQSLKPSGKNHFTQPKWQRFAVSRNFTHDLA